MNHQKWLEIRKSAPTKEGPFRIWAYVSGTGKVCGCATVEKIVQMTPEEIAAMGGSALTLEELKKYANGQPLYVWFVKDPRMLKKVFQLDFRPPISWRYCYTKRTSSKQVV